MKPTREPKPEGGEATETPSHEADEREAEAAAVRFMERHDAMFRRLAK